MSASWILVVDDDADIRDLLLMSLEARGYQVAGASDGVDALKSLQGRPSPSLILLDLMMPQLDGIEFMKALRAVPALAHIPVLVLSGDVAAVQRSARSGAQGCLKKPVELDELVRAVQQLAGTPEAPRVI